MNEWMAIFGSMNLVQTFFKIFVNWPLNLISCRNWTFPMLSIRMANQKLTSEFVTMITSFASIINHGQRQQSSRSWSASYMNKIWHLPFSSISICSCVKDVLFLCSFFFSWNLNSASSWLFEEAGVLFSTLTGCGNSVAKKKEDMSGGHKLLHLYMCWKQCCHLKKKKNTRFFFFL